VADRVRITGYDGGRDADVSDNGCLNVQTGAINAANKVYEDTAFEAGDSPAVHDFFTDAGRVATRGYIICDGDGSFSVDISRDGINYDAKWTMKKAEKASLDGMYIKKIRVTRGAADSAYRINLL
jgi:hypothetical protein